MRLTIFEPAVIEAEGPITVTPIPAQPKQEGWDGVERRVKQEHPHPLRRSTDETPATRQRRRGPHSRSHKDCLHCGRSYLAYRAQKYCSRTCKQAFYRKYGAAKKVADDMRKPTVLSADTRSA